MVFARMGMRALLIGALVVGACESPGDRSVRWSYLHAAILEPACTTAGCHSKLTAIAGVDLSTAEGAYNVLVGIPCDEHPSEVTPDRNYVAPGSSQYSTLMYQLRGESPDGTPYRDVMPPDFRLPSHEVDLVARWIDEGAACD